MKTPLKISILLNLGLLSGLIVFLATRIAPVAPQTPPPALESRPPESVAATRAGPIPEEHPPFRWSQLEAKDYHVYVKNLRQIGCPEPTVRAIVTADVDSVYQLVANQLEAKLSAANNASWPKQFSALNSESELSAALQKLPEVEAAKINDLLGSPVDSQATVAALASAAHISSDGGQSPAANRQAGSLTAQRDAAAVIGTPGSSPAADAPAPTTMSSPTQLASDIPLPPVPKSAALPLVFQPVDPAAANLSASQVQTVNELRQEFTTALRGSSQDPADPAYQQAWQQAMTQSDRLLEANLGQNGYVQYWDAQWDAQHPPVPAN